MAALDFPSGALRDRHDPGEGDKKEDRYEGGAVVVVVDVDVVVLLGALPLSSFCASSM
jgi:hypothetical protein